MPVQLNYWKVAPEALGLLTSIEKYLKQAFKDNKDEQILFELVKTRISQINQCAYCIDIHTKDARALGETEQRLYALNAWHESPYYSAKERAALAWGEAVTLLGEQGPTDELREHMRKFFDDKSIVNFTLAITTINTWNRLAISFGADVGSYEVGQFDI
ncbi:carboxymuconolactone decarboxylase family protein [Aliikangiella sp. IMCC44359]|uniref:carboxymuconolactone decarboxylase family protein n=1 Tax=Aliikangiella sp. IMCC44359 TaxID=3459125 RepID=UPI00403A9EFF